MSENQEVSNEINKDDELNSSLVTIKIDYTKRAHSFLKWVCLILFVGIVVLTGPSFIKEVVPSNFNSLSFLNEALDVISFIILGAFSLLFFLKKQAYKSFQIVALIILVMDVATEIALKDSLGVVVDILAWGSLYLLASKKVSRRMFRITVFMFILSILLPLAQVSYQKGYVETKTQELVVYQKDLIKTNLELATAFAELVDPSAIDNSEEYNSELDRLIKEKRKSLEDIKTLVNDEKMIKAVNANTVDGSEGEDGTILAQVWKDVIIEQEKQLNVVAEIHQKYQYKIYPDLTKGELVELQRLIDEVYSLENNIQQASVPLLEYYSK